MHREIQPSEDQVRPAEMGGRDNTHYFPAIYDVLDDSAVPSSSCGSLSSLDSRGANALLDGGGDSATVSSLVALSLMPGSNSVDMRGSIGPVSESGVAMRCSARATEPFIPSRLPVKI